MKVFVTGASGFVGSAVVEELLRAGHAVVGLARSDASAARIASAGAAVHRGDLADLEGLRRAAAAAEGVIHTAFNHDDFSNMAPAIAADLAAIEAMGAVLEGKPFITTIGLSGLVSPAAEDQQPSPGHRAASGHATLALAQRGVRAMLMRLPPTVHGPNDPNFVTHFARAARDRKLAGYPGAGTNRWSAVHRLDAARAYRLALERGTPGAVFHAVAEEGVPFRALAEAVGRVLGVPTASLSAEALAATYGWLARFLSADMAATSQRTQAELGWKPSEPGLLHDVDAGLYPPG